MQQSHISTPYMYPSSPMSNVGLYDSGYSSIAYASPSSTTNSFHFSSCPYSNDSYYIPQSSCYQMYYNSPTYSMQQYAQPNASSTPVQPSNVYVVPPSTNLQPKRSRQQTVRNTASPSLSSARKRISDEAIERLNAFYAIKKRPTEAEKDRLAMECNITVAQVNTWFNNARSRRGDTNPKLTQKLLKQQIESLNNQIVLLQQQQE